MQFTIKLLIIALAVTSMSLAPSLLINKSADAASHYCTEYKGKSQAWIDGCKQGWSDHDHCLGFDPGDGKSNDYWNGYNTGWDKGHCK
ncbi:MAG TPA: hypothetical protein VD815_06235 [Candidatus Saccharimonadales bacterium]|nr:hypothetical protein [Candidatus Saccharimonadales bacterium]